VVFKPNVFVSTHVRRRFEKAGIQSLMNVGSVLKNLLGLMQERRKASLYKKLVTLLLDAYEAIGRIYLAVLDGTYAYQGVGKRNEGLKTNFPLVGRDATAVEAVGGSFVGLDSPDTRSHGKGAW